MTATVSIRAFVPDDMATVIDLLQDVSPYRPAAKTVPALAEAFAAQEDCHAFVAELDGRLIAFGSVFVLNRVRGGRSGIIEDVVVAPDVRGQGVGRQIVDALVSAAWVRDCFKVSLESAESAESFYRGLGFESAGKAMKISFLVK